jgi:hypothetical protein
MKLSYEIVTFATEEARKKWEGKELPKKNKRSGCPSCELEALKSERTILKKENPEENN